MKIKITEEQSRLILQNFNSDLISEEFNFYNLSFDEKEKVYQLFKDSYEKATGKAWTKDKFLSHASNWTFMGDLDGFIAVRKQAGGLTKLTGTAGSMKGVSKGIDELISNNVPVWGMMNDRLANILVDKYGFIRPPGWIVKILMDMIPKNAYGNADLLVNKDGSVTLNYSDIGEATKYLVGNKAYFTYLLENTLKNKTSVPKLLILTIKKLAGL